MTVTPVNIGAFQVDVLRCGEFWLDGGAMFGVVPRAVWERLTPPDAQNRIRLQTNCMLIRGEGCAVLVDTGIGDKVDERFRERFRVQPGGGSLAALEDLGLGSEDITHVVNSHLHWDHAGGNTARGRRGGLVPRFPRARYVVQRGEWEDALQATERTRASYRPDDYLPLESTGLVELVEGPREIVPGVSVFTLPGHNRCMQGVRIRSGQATAVYLSDLVPTRHHLRYPFIMGYDLYPAMTLETKRKILPLAEAGRWLVIFDHDPDHPLAYLGKDARGNLTAVPADVV